MQKYYKLSNIKEDDMKTIKLVMLIIKLKIENYITKEIEKSMEEGLQKIEWISTKKIILCIFMGKILCKEIS